MKPLMLSKNGMEKHVQSLSSISENQTNILTSFAR